MKLSELDKHVCDVWAPVLEKEMTQPLPEIFREAIKGRKLTKYQKIRNRLYCKIFYFREWLSEKIKP